MNKVLKILKWSIAVVYVFLLLALDSNKQKKQVIEQVAIHFENNQVGLLSQQDIIDFLKQNNVFGLTMNNINLANLEKQFLSLSAVKQVDVFKNVDGQLSVKIKLREPIIRIITMDYKSFYLDKDGQIIEVKYNKAPRLIIVNGKLSQKDMMEYKSNPNLKTNSVYGIYHLARALHNDGFWNAQIQQLYVHGNKEIELTPTVGPHTILFGQPNNIQQKLRNLKALYKVGFKNKGWNKYKTINLKFKDQIVCTKN